MGVPVRAWTAQTRLMLTPLNLEDLVVHLADDYAIRPCTPDDGFWERRDRLELSTGHLVSLFSYDRIWSYQERHADGDELAILLSGAADVLLDSGAGEQRVGLTRWSACVIPRGSWHRVAPHAPSTLLFVTPVPAATQHREAR